MTPRSLVHGVVAVLSLGCATVLAAFVGFLLLWAVDPGYEAQPAAALFALVPAAASFGLLAVARRTLFGSWWIGIVPAAAAVAVALVVYATASGPDKGAASRAESALLTAIRPYPGSQAGTVATAAESSSDWGISLINPPESYTTSRVDKLPARVAASSAADFYEHELKADGFRVYRFLLHIPVNGTVHLGGHRGSAYVEIDVTPLGRTSLSATL